MWWPALSAVSGRRSVNPASRAVPISSIEPNVSQHRATGIDELDRVLGGGVVPGSVTLLAGDPGVGKSTLLLMVAHLWAQAGRRALYISGEESAGQIRLRADRIGCGSDEVYLAAESDVHTVLEHIATVKPALVIVDSVQTMSSTESDGVAGGVTQVRAVTAALTAAAKANGVALILVGHVTKDGAIAGPRSLEHLVDVVLHFEGDRNGSLRMVRGIKNRFGGADEVGCFLLHDNGIEGVADPSNLFLDQRPTPVAGTAITVDPGRQAPADRRSPGVAGHTERRVTAPRRQRDRSLPRRDDHRRAGKARQAAACRQRHLPVHRGRHAVDRSVLGPRRRDRAGLGTGRSAAAHHRGDGRRGRAGGRPAHGSAGWIGVWPKRHGRASPSP